MPVEGERESQLYGSVRKAFESLFIYNFGNCHLEITAFGQFSEKLKEKIKQDIVFTFIKRMKGSEHRSPDITGFSTGSFGNDHLVTIEVKNETISLGDVYQAKMYAELFYSEYGFLVSVEPIPTELKKLHQVHHILNRFVSGTRLLLVEFDSKTSQIVHDSWFPERPFSYDLADLLPLR